MREFRDELFKQMDRLKVSRELASRYLNDGFSGGEKKRVEILQMAMLKPRMAVLDETDSGLDIDALKVVAGGVKELVSPEMGALVITHYKRILNYIEPDHVHVFVDGRIVESGGPELADKLEEFGYEEWGGERRPRERRGAEWQPLRTGARRAKSPMRPQSTISRTRTRSSARSARTTPRSTASQIRTRPRTTSSSRAAGSRTSSSRRSPSTRTSRSGCGSSATSRSTTSWRAPLPTWGGDVSGIDFDNIYYYIKPTEKQANSWEDLPADIKDTWDKLGIPEAEKKYLAGVGAQYESEVVYHKVQEELAKQGVIFLDMDSGLREHEELVKQYFGTIIP